LHTVALSKYTSNEEILFRVVCVGEQKTSLEIFSGGHLILAGLGDTEFGT
jgi:hypothetical protein